MYHKNLHTAYGSSRRNIKGSYLKWKDRNKSMSMYRDIARERIGHFVSYRLKN